MIIHFTSQKPLEKFSLCFTTPIEFANTNGCQLWIQRSCCKSIVWKICKFFLNCILINNEFFFFNLIFQLFSAFHLFANVRFDWLWNAFQIGMYFLSNWCIFIWFFWKKFKMCFCFMIFVFIYFFFFFTFKKEKSFFPWILCLIDYFLIWKKSYSKNWKTQKTTHYIFCFAKMIWIFNCVNGNLNLKNRMLGNYLVEEQLDVFFKVWLFKFIYFYFRKISCFFVFSKNPIVCGEKIFNTLKYYSF